MDDVVDLSHIVIILFVGDIPEVGEELMTKLMKVGNFWGSIQVDSTCVSPGRVGSQDIYQTL